ncbi:hypothetical protein [Nocardioides pelophilus]|uniref:hypothetical protein n=1 Tax=Nocardioides pelophilus TaxID=2172019 RepID=UPI0015FEFE92|nr:hypothetical protein [Nocardioides pelophilus]
MKAGRGGRAAAVLALVAALVASLPASPGAARGAGDAPTLRDEVRVVYDGFGVRVWRHSGQIDRLSDTPRAFRLLVRAQLDYMWVAYNDSAPACEQAPLVTVKEVRRRVAYISNQGTFPGGPGDAPDSCATGGAFHFYVKRDGDWIAPRALGGQDLFHCRTLRRWSIPRMVGARQCWNGEEVVRWDP